MDANQAERLLAALERIAQALEAQRPKVWPAIDFATTLAARWHCRAETCGLEAIRNVQRVEAEWLVAVKAQLARIDANTRQFVQGRPAHHVLLTGSRGTGKSSLVKAMLTRYAKRGLRLIEVDKAHLADLPEITEQVRMLPYRFIVFCDDLAFDEGDGSYRALKAVLDGSVAAASSNLLIYATSNRRHLMPEYLRENEATRYVGEEVHLGESVEEKISLSERFGLWISFYPFSQEDYLAAVKSWIEHLGAGWPRSEKAIAALEQEALQWALQRGSRSGRVAWQFAQAWVGRMRA